MRPTRNHCVRWISLPLLPFIVLLLMCSSVCCYWVSVSPSYEDNYWELNAVHFTSPDEGWAVGTDKALDANQGVLLHYNAGTWTSVTPPNISSDWEPQSVHFTSADEGWLVGTNRANDNNWKGVILQYTNKTWISTTSPTVGDDWFLKAVHFTSPDEGWAVGGYFIGSVNRRGVLLQYTGGIWTSVLPPIVSGIWELNAVHFTSPDEGWAVGTDYESTNRKGVLLHYTKNTWTSVTPPSIVGDWELYGLHFTSAEEGWAVGTVWSYPHHIGVLLHYQSGVWTSVTPSVLEDCELFAVHFTSPDEGWAVGRTQTGLKTSVSLHYINGIWRSVPPPVVGEYWNLRGVHFTSPDEGWAVGSNDSSGSGLLLKSVSLSPNAGTIGTRITITGAGFGSKKGKVLIEGVAAKIAKDGWTDNRIVCDVKKVPPIGGPYNVRIMPYKVDSPISLFNTFTVKGPEIDQLQPNHGISGTPIVITGKFFSTKKGKIYLEYSKDGQTKTKNCKVESWGMDSITFVVPKTSKSFPAGSYLLRVTNKVETAVAPENFTVD